MSLAAGSRLGAYEVVSLLGSGGMGEVYRARDTRLGREIALKVLSKALADDPARLERFAREARAVAALNHPHIVTIHSTEEAAGVRFLTMELVDGQGLDTLIPPEGLPLDRFLEIAMPLADALTAAHQKQITHRDLKPANVMIAADGRVKVLDFGLARFEASDPDDPATSATRLALTQEGMIVGTMPYMSPEQISGLPLDHRSDLFSLGVMFYEMLTGARPFQGDSPPLLMSAILRDTPMDVSERRPDVPATLARIVSRCLEKRPEERVQTARDIHNELRHVRKQRESDVAGLVPGSGSGPRIRPGGEMRIAVLPFQSRTPDEAASSLAEGLTEDITAYLSRFNYLRVVSRGSADRINAHGPDLRAAGAQLGARYLLEGSVRKAGGSVRVGVRLVDAGSGAHLWAENYDRDAGAGTFALQDDIASRVVATIASPSGVLVRSMALGLRDQPIEHLGIGDLLVRYHAYVEQFRPEEHARLRDGFERAVELEPGNASAWGCLAMLYEHEHSHRLNPQPHPVERLRQAAERAVEADPVNQQAWLSLASASFFARDLTGLRTAAERTMALNPLQGDAAALLAIYLSSAGDIPAGMELVRRAMELNALHPGWYHFVPFMQWYQRREYEEALVHAKRINMPLFPWAHLSAAAAAGQLARPFEARAALEALGRIHPALADPRYARDDWALWIWNEELLERLVEGVEKAQAISVRPA